MRNHEAYELDTLVLSLVARCLLLRQELLGVILRE